MPLINTQQHYGVIAILFHWLSAIAIIALFVVGLWMMEVGYEHSWYDLAVHYHESIGMLLIIIMILRWLWRQYNILPRFSNTLSSLEKRSAISVHRLLYLLCFIILITGYLIPTADGRSIDIFNWFSVPALIKLEYQQVDIAGDMHFWLASLLVGLSGIHSLAALKHSFFDKHNPLNKIH